MDIEDDRLFTYCVIRAPYFIRNFPDKSAWDDVVTSLARGKIDSNQETSDGENKKRFHCYTGECVKCCKEGSAVTMTILDLYRIWSLLKQQGHEKNFRDLFVENIDSEHFYIVTVGGSIVVVLDQLPF